MVIPQPSQVVEFLLHVSVTVVSQNRCNVSVWKLEMGTFDTSKHPNTQTNSFLSASLKKAVRSLCFRAGWWQKCPYTKGILWFGSCQGGTGLLASSGTERLCDTALHVIRSFAKLAFLYIKQRWQDHETFLALLSAYETKKLMLCLLCRCRCSHAVQLWSS